MAEFSGCKRAKQHQANKKKKPSLLSGSTSFHRTFSRFDTLWFPLIPKSVEICSWKKFWIKNETLNTHYLKTFWSAKTLFFIPLLCRELGISALYTKKSLKIGGKKSEQTSLILWLYRYYKAFFFKEKQKLQVHFLMKNEPIIFKIFFIFLVYITLK